MTAGHAKSWWQTFPGFLTGIAALITAVAGLLAVLMQAGWIARGTPVNPAVAGPTIESATPSTSTPRAELRPADSPIRRASVAGKGASPEEPTAAPSIVRQAFEVTLPSKREYTLGTGISKWTFMLLAARVTPETPESDALAIRWRFMSRSEYGKDYRSHFFRLLVDGATITPELSFIHQIPPRESRNGDLAFIVPAGTSRAVLRIDDFGSNAEIPLELAPQ